MKLQKEIAVVLACFHKHKNYRVIVIESGEDGFAAQIQQININDLFRIIVSWGGGWDHVSVSLIDRCPTWAEMCWIKGIFWNENESVIQYHPAKDEYVNCHEYCLHLWKPQNCVMPTPPIEFVGIKE